MRERENAALYLRLYRAHYVRGYKVYISPIAPPDVARDTHTVQHAFFRFIESAARALFESTDTVAVNTHTRYGFTHIPTER